MTHLLCYAGNRFPEQYGVVKIKIRALRIAHTEGVKLALTRVATANPVRVGEYSTASHSPMTFISSNYATN